LPGRKEGRFSLPGNLWVAEEGHWRAAVCHQAEVLTEGGDIGVRGAGGCRGAGRRRG